MTFKQPRVPEYRENDNTGQYLKTLVLFLKDFSQEAWWAVRQTDKGLLAANAGLLAVNEGIAGIKYPVTSVNGEIGDVQIDSVKRAESAEKLNGMTWAEMMLALYPVGSIYISAHSASPAGMFGGSWERLEGRVLIGAGTGTDNQPAPETRTFAAGETNGEYRHALKVDEMPSHTHRVSAGLSGSQYMYYGNGFGPSGNNAYGLRITATEPEGSHRINARQTGGNALHNNLPPYYAAYMWKRVA